MRFLPLAAAALVAACVLPGAASADSVVYAKGSYRLQIAPAGGRPRSAGFRIVR